jgi:hypothetical protein
MILNQSFSFFPLQSVYRRAIRRSPVINPHIMFSGVTNYYFVPVFLPDSCWLSFWFALFISRSSSSEAAAGGEVGRPGWAGGAGSDTSSSAGGRLERQKKTVESRYHFWWLMLWQFSAQREREKYNDRWSSRWNRISLVAALRHISFCDTYITKQEQRQRQPETDIEN